MMRSLFFLGIAVVMTACMQTSVSHWQHKTIPSSQWKTDQNRCKRAADKHLGMKSQYQADQGLDQYNEQMRNFEAGKKHSKLVGDCMRKLGYVPVG